MNWQRVYDAAYEHAAPDPLLDTTCWKDSYSGAPIPAEQMAEWVNDTVVRILELKPRRILEIGCGTGLLLYRLAPHCDEYVGLDISQTAIERLTADLAARGREFAHVSVHQRGADQLQDFAARRFDLVIINSVVMYFPSEDYLSSVLDNAVGMVGRGRPRLCRRYPRPRLRRAVLSDGGACPPGRGYGGGRARGRRPQACSD